MDAYKHQHAHEHVHNHKNTRRGVSSAGVVATEIASMPLSEALQHLDVHAKALGLADKLWPTGIGKIVHTDLDQQPEVKAPPEDGLEELAEQSQLSALLRINTLAITAAERALAKRWLLCLHDPFRDFLLSASQPAPSYEFNPADAIEERKTRERFGRPRFSDADIASQLDVSLAQLQQLKERVRQNAVPAGIGAVSAWEYRYLQAKYCFAQPLDWLNEVDGADFASLILKKRYQEKMGDQAESLWRVLEAYTCDQYQKETRGNKPRLAYSAKRLANSYQCSELVAQAALSLLQEMPVNLFEEIAKVFATRGKSGAARGAAKPEMQLIHEPAKDRYSVRWLPEANQRVMALKSPQVEQFMRAVEALSGEPATGNVSSKAAAEKAIAGDPTLSRDDLEELADRFLCAHGADDVVRETARVQGPTAKQPTNESQLSSTQKIVERLRGLEYYHRIYQGVLEGIRFRPGLAQYMCNYQALFIQTGEKKDLKPLTKSAVVEALGYIPSSQRKKLSGDAETRRRINVGRRMERYIGSSSVLKPDGSVLRLEDLIPSRARAKNATGEQVTGETIKNYLQQVLNGEPEESPYSDRQLADKLRMIYGVVVNRRSVANYRRSMRVASSAGRGKQAG